MVSTLFKLPPPKLLIRLIMCTVLLISIYSCERDDQDARATTLPLAQSSSTITTVSSKEIPEVMEYVQSITPKTGKFAVQSENNGVRSSEPDLVLGELQLDEINTVTDENAKTNYTFRLKTIDTNYEGFVSHFNLVIKETTSGLYSYIVEYRMMDYWYSTQRRGIDLNNYNGHFVYYQSNGTYFGKVDFIDGAIIDVQQKICDNPPDNDTGGGGNGNNGDTGNTGDTGNSDSGDSGNGGYDITITTQCCYGVHSDSSAPGCQCVDLPDIIIIEMNFADPTNDSEDKNFYRNLRNPCPPDDHCASENDCEYGWNDDCSCKDEPTEEDENMDVAIIIVENIAPDCILLTNLSNSEDFQNKMEELLDNNDGETEIGYWGREDEDDNATYSNDDRFESEPGSRELNPLLPSGTIDSYIHNHFNDGNGSLPTFSPADVYTLGLLRPSMSHQPDFVAVMTAPGDNVNSADDDTVYAIIINNTSDFSTFANTILSNLDFAESFFYEEGLRQGASSDIVERQMVEILQENDSGLRIYRGDKNNLSSWTRIRMNNNGDLIERNCN